MAPRVVRTIDEAKALVGQEIGVSGWLVVDQGRIGQFASATDDHQWIHIDVDRAKREMPGGQTIAHGYLLLSLMPALMDMIVELPTLERAINYGLNKVRFKNPVPAGEQLPSAYLQQPAPKAARLSVQGHARPTSRRPTGGAA